MTGRPDRKIRLLFGSIFALQVLSKYFSLKSNKLQSNKFLPLRRYMRTLLVLTCYLLLVGSPLFSQNKAESYTSCDGMLYIFESGSYHLQLTGSKDEINAFAEYPALQSFTTSNLIWFSFIAPAKGSIELNATATQSDLRLIAFEQTGDWVCDDIQMGMAEIKRMIVPPGNKSVGLHTDVRDGFMYPISVEAGRSVYFALIGDPEIADRVELSFKFVPESDEELSAIESKELDFRNDDFAPTFAIHIRNKETGKPIIANLTVSGTKCIDGLYKGSDIYYNVRRNCDLTFNCEAEGFFFIDSSEIKVSSIREDELIIELDPVRSGKSIQLEEIEFKPGTSEFTPASEPRLKRLRDFLALNADLKIEIQGHVFEMGDHNSAAGQKVSEARAKRVMKYLIESGIDKSRMTAIGYGNTKPVYPEPKFSYEEQANRRVEIVVK